MKPIIIIVVGIYLFGVLIWAMAELIVILIGKWRDR